MSIRVGNYELLPATEIDPRDSRGIVWVWEEPSARARYIVSCDPSVGITGWHRSLRTRDDTRTDNCAIEVIRCGNPDVQVAEFAAPIDPYDAAAVVNALGRIYGGNDEESQAHCIIEVYPGPGMSTLHEMISKYGYINLFQWKYLDKFVPKATTSYGWYSNSLSRKMLWVQGTRHITKRKFRIQSPWLIEEMVDLRPDNFLAFTSRAASGCHDDRMVSTLMGLWAANEWSMNYEPTEAAKPEQAESRNWQAMDCSAEDMTDMWEERFSEIMGEG